MGCDFVDRTGAYLDGELPAAARAAYAAHLPHCAECSREVTRLERLSRFLSAAAISEVPAPRRYSVPQRLNRQKVVRLAELLMAAASLVIAVCGIQLFRLSESAASVSAAGWERVAVTRQLPAWETDDPVVQALLQEQLQ